MTSQAMLGDALQDFSLALSDSLALARQSQENNVELVFNTDSLPPTMSIGCRCVDEKFIQYTQMTTNYLSWSGHI